MIVPASGTRFASRLKFASLPFAAALLLGLGATPASAFVYSLDDGSAEDAVGEAPPGGDLIYLNSFSVNPADPVVTSISVAFGSPDVSSNAALNGAPITVLLYSDPNNDGNPTDASLLASGTGVISAIDTNTFITYAIAPTAIPTTDFFVAFEIQNQPTNDFAAGLDKTYPTYAGDSWVTYGAAGTINPNNLAANQVPPKTIESFGDPGNWLIRANAVPEASTWAYVLGGIAGGGLLFRRRRQS